MSRNAGITTGTVEGVASGCRLEWLRAHGLWSAADDAAVLARYAPSALDSHWWCCIEQPWLAEHGL